MSASPAAHPAHPAADRTAHPAADRTARPAARPALVALVATLALLAGALATAPTAQAAPAGKAGQAKRYTPRPGAIFNNPLAGPAKRTAILRHVLRSVESAPRGSTVRFASWNIRGRNVVDALVDAHRRGVTVRVVMDRKNAYRLNPNREVNRLQQELKRHGNRARDPQAQSGLRKCRASCRGRSGFGHSKFFLFSQAGQARSVVVNTSANATDLSASAQWNDAWTMVGNQPIYDAFALVFDQMFADQPVPGAHLVAQAGPVTAEFYPYTGPDATGDPALRELDRVTCRGATNTGSGRTRIRIAMTSWHGDRGIAIGKRVKQLSREGCDIAIVYAVMGGAIRKDLSRGRARVPMRHIVQDPDRDGVYDRYLHTKILTIKGVLGDQTGAAVTINGSANWTPLSLVSDEAVLRLDDAAVTRRYSRWVDRLFAHPPRNAPRGTTRGIAAGWGAAPAPAAYGARVGARTYTGAYAEVQPD